MPKKQLIIGLVVLALGVGVFFFIRSRNANNAPAPSPTPVALPVNTIPVSERPFITLSPDTSGRNLFLTVAGAPQEGLMEYELVYQASEKQEGVFGRLDLATEKQPIEKKLLLGSQSAGGKITYHEGVTGGSLTVTYGETKLKEQFNFLRFDPTDPSVVSSDVHFTASFGKTAFTKNSVIIVMKSFGYPDGLPADTALVAGPYTYLAPAAAKGDVEISVKLPAGDHVNPTLYEYDAKGEVWAPLDSTVKDDTVSATSTGGTLFVVIAE